MLLLTPEVTLLLALLALLAPPAGPADEAATFAGRVAQPDLTTEDAAAGLTNEGAAATAGVD